MKRALVALIAGTILSGFAAAYATTSQNLAAAETRGAPAVAPAKADSGILAAR